MIPCKTATRNLVILLIEDDPGDQELTRRVFLDSAFNTDLRVVSDGEEAMSYLNQSGAYQDPQSSPKPDLILLDLNMPRMDGAQVLAEIRNTPKLRSIPVVMLTTSIHEKDVSRSYSIGCNSYLAKPIDLDQFNHVLRQLENYWFNLVTLPEKAV